ncbi:MAG: biotin transporter BioY [Clostridium sp.]|uniref:biotin transporter BioY n=1 Tax=Clostridium sp. TaxID=1506 RepID=UPI003F3A941F
MKFNLTPKDMILIALFAALTGVGAFIRIPLPVVPITLQIVFSLMSGVVLGAKRGMISQLLYIFIGLIGIPVFTSGGGPQYVLSPTFGYLIGMVFGAYVVGKLREKIKEVTILKLFLICMVGVFVIYIFGLLHLYIIKNFYLGQDTSMWNIIYSGFLVTITGDIVKAIIVALTSKKLIKIANS